jgi:hypothetical protein
LYVFVCRLFTVALSVTKNIEPKYSNL